ncbi:MAG TPA: PilZ domain-containing protein [Anaeromyxobacteraceae bacterium]|nr:PilZ domain-containing protein [Anaeromyxobacteraceae bacterium]
MSLREWVAHFKALHEKARTGALNEAGWSEYRAGRDELARAMLAAQRAALRPGETPRRALRVARALQADLEWSLDKVRAVTLDISSGGFAALLAKAPPRDEGLRVQLRLPGGDAVAAEARVAGAQVLPTSVRVAFAFSRISDGERDRLEFLVFDTVLAHLAT